MNNDVPQSVTDFIYAQEHRLLDDNAGRAVARVIEAGVSDAFVQGVIVDRVRRHRIAQAFAGPFESPNLHRGKIILGDDLKGRPVRIPLQSLNGHTLVVAGSGAGKTILARWLALQIAVLLPGVWLFDLRKREFGHLVSHLAHLGVDLIILPARQLRLNPLQVPKFVTPIDWAARIAEVLVMVLRLPQRAAKLIHATLLVMYKVFGIIDGGASYPTLFELREAIATDSQANPQAKQALIDSLDPVLLSIGPILAWRRGWTTDDLTRRHIVFEFAGLAEPDKDLILNTLVLGEFTSRIARGLSNVPMDLWICCDEAGRLISPTNETGGISELIALVRGSGVGLFLAGQSAEVSPAVLSNTATKVIGRCGSARDYDVIGGAMGLTTEQRRYLSLNLVPGLFAAQVGEGDWRRPFLFRVPLADSSIDSPVSIDGSTAPLLGNETSDSLDALKGIPVEPALEFSDWSPNRRCVLGKTPTPSPQPGELGDADIRFLQAVVAHPALPSSAYSKLVGVGPKRAQDIRQRLIGLGFLREHAVATGGRGRTAIVLEPSETAYRVLALDPKLPEATT